MWQITRESVFEWKKEYNLSDSGKISYNMDSLDLQNRVKRLEDESSVIQNIQTAYQQATYLYNQLGSTLESLEKRVKTQADNHEQLASYVDTLPKGSSNQDVIYEFERIGAVLGNIFNIFDLNKRVFAIGETTGYVPQNLGARYNYNPVKVSHPDDLRFSAGSIEILLPGKYLATMRATVGSDRWRGGAGREDRDWLVRSGVGGVSGVGILVNGTFFTSSEVVTFNGPINVHLFTYFEVRNPTIVGGACSQAYWGDTKYTPADSSYRNDHNMYYSQLLVERLGA